MIDGRCAALPVTRPPARAADALPDHLVRLQHEEWALWRWTALRGAGFSASHPDLLAAPRSAALADALLQAEDDAVRTRAGAIGRLKSQMRAAPHERRRAIRRAIRHVRRGKAIEPPDLDVAAVGRLSDLRTADLCVASARERFRRGFDEDTACVSAALARIAADDRFREAMLWQNRRAVHGGVDALVRNRRAGAPRDSRRRQNEEMLATYVQRYCLKNDTIGFFGPVGWARLVPSADAITLWPGPTLLAARHVYFEVWGIDALAAVFATEPGLERWLAPRPMHFVHIERGKLLLPGRAPVPLGPRDEAIFRSCDGVATAHEISSRLDDPAVIDRLRDLREQGLISWTLAVPIVLNPERALARALDRIEDERLRRDLLGRLDQLEQARRCVASAAGRGDDLDRALTHLDATFTRLTGREPTRSPGKTYAARTLVYEDCRRDVDVRIGRDVIAALSAPLALLLASARWLTFDVARRYHVPLVEIYREIAQRTGTPAVNFTTFWYRAQPVLFGEQAPLVDQAVHTLQQRWARVLGPADDRRSREYATEELRPRVEAAFDAPGPGWRYARYHSPDVMIAARDVDAIRQGEYQLVLGELHVGANTLGWPLFMAQHPNPDELLQAVDFDLPEPRLEPIIPKSFWPGQTARLLPSLVTPKDFRLELSADPSDAPPSRTLPAAALVTRSAGHRLIVATRDGRLEFDLLDVIGPALTRQIASRFSIVAPAAHAPRISFGRLVVVRESWRVPAGAMRFAWEADERDRFVAARRWARAHGLPRWVFVRTPLERKPFYVDLTSPTYINILAKQVRRSLEASATASISLTEMLPLADHAWLRDREGRAYTSEFRIVAVDLASVCIGGSHD